MRYLKKQPNCLGVETVESVERNLLCLDFSQESFSLLSTVEYSGVESVESVSEDSILSTVLNIGVESQLSKFLTENILNSKLQQFQQFQQGNVEVSSA